MAQIINADDGVISGSAGLKSSSDGTAVLSLQTKGTTALTIDASQNLGVGTTSPGYKLTVQSAIDTYAFNIRDTIGNERVLIGSRATAPIDNITPVQIANDNDGNLLLSSRTNNASGIKFYSNAGTAAVERARITSGGGVGINRTDPASYGQLAIKWDPTATSVNNGVGLSIDTATNTTNAVFAQWVNENGNGIGSVTRVAQTNAVAYNTTSDRRLKENIFPADDAGSVIDAIEIVKHDWKEGGHVRYGVVAQDLHEVAPEAVSPGDPDDVEKLKRSWGVDYSKLVPILVKEVQSLRKRVAELETK